MLERFGAALRSCRVGSYGPKGVFLSDRQYEFVLHQTISLGGGSYGYRGFVLPDRQHEVVLLRVAAVYHVFLVWVTVRIRTTVRELIYVRSICF